MQIVITANFAHVTQIIQREVIIYIPDPSVCGEMAGREVELSELSWSKTVNGTTTTPTSTCGGKHEKCHQ